MNSPLSETHLENAAEERIWNFEHVELGKVEVQLEPNARALRMVLESERVSLELALTVSSSQAVSVSDWHASTRSGEVKHARFAVMLCFDFLFSLYKTLQHIGLNKEMTYLLPQQLNDDLQVSRVGFYQWPELWLTKQLEYPEARVYTETNGVRHPVRPPQPVGDVYRRFVPEVAKTLSFRPIDPVADLDVFHKWMNDSRVAAAWELDKPKEELAQYLQQRAQDPHIYSVVGSFDGELFGYFELYWTPEDRLGPYYEASDYDRGVHLLVGNRKFLGGNYFYCWFTGLLHQIFLEDPRTERVMGEPRADNQVLLRHTQSVVSFKKMKEFDFPHKRAALMQCERDAFFELVSLP